MEISKKVKAARVQPQSKAPVAHGVGRRKSSVARVWVTRGNGGVTVNTMSVQEYFDTSVTRTAAVTALNVLHDIAQNYDFNVNVKGGGLCGQADAMKLGIARALVERHPEARGLLRGSEVGNLLNVDSRVKERKKYGQKGARRKFQFVKR